jgi:YbbR domain-containing protein
VPVDVKDITGPTTKTVTLHLPDGITRANEDNIEVTITPKATQESSEKQSSATSSEDSADSSSE